MWCWSFKYLSQCRAATKKKGGKKNFFSLFWFGFGHSRLSDFFLYLSRAFYATNSKEKRKKFGRRSGPKINPKSSKKKPRDFACHGGASKRDRETERDTERHRERRRVTRAVKKSMAYDATLQFLTDEELAALIKPGLCTTPLLTRKSGVGRSIAGTARAVQLHRVAAQLGSDEQSLGALGRDREPSLSFLPSDFVSSAVFIEEHRKKQKSDDGEEWRRKRRRRRRE